MDIMVTVADEFEERILSESIQIFLRHMSKRGMVLQRDIMKLYEKVAEASRPILFDQMKGEILRVFGQKVVSYDTPKGTWLMLKDTLEYKPEAGDDPVLIEKCPRNKILSAVLMYMYMSDDTSIAKKIPEEKIIKIIEKVRQNPLDDMESLSHISTKEFIKEFIYQGWIELDATLDDTVKTYSWGPRAWVTVDRMELLEKFCGIMGDQPQEYKLFLEDAMKASQQSDV